MNSPTFPKETKKLVAVKVHDQMQNQSGSISNFFQNPNINTDMSSVSNLEGIERSVQQRFEGQRNLQQQPPCLLLNSPTFNTLDNRFESLNPDSSRVLVGGLGATGSREQIVKNVFTDNTWPVLKNNDSHFNDQRFQEDGPRIASPNALEPASQDEMDISRGPSKQISNLFFNDQRNHFDGQRISHHDSLNSQGARSHKSSRAQPSQGAVNKEVRSTMQSRESKTKRGSISPNHKHTASTPQKQSRSGSTMKISAKKGPTSKNSRSPSPSPDDICEGQSPLITALNVVSSDTFLDRQVSPIIKNRRQKQKNKSPDGYKKMNKEPNHHVVKEAMPHRTGTQIFSLDDQKQLKKDQTQEKHSAKQAHRQRVSSIAHNIQIKAEMNRLNLKTREDVLSKRNKNMILINGIRANRARLDASHDLSSPPELSSDYQQVQTQHNYVRDVLSKAKDNYKINSSFLKQSEILRMKPDGFRRISIQTDMEFGGHTGYATHRERDVIQGTGLHPLSPSRVTDTIFEDERGIEDDESLWGMNESNSSSLLPKTRRVQKTRQIKDSVLKSRNESTRIADILSQPDKMNPSIKKALNDRANFYRRKLTFYENLGVLAVSMTSQEIQAKLAEIGDMNSSQATSVVNRLSSMHQNRQPTSTGDNTRLNTPQIIQEDNQRDSELLPELTDSPDKTKAGNILSGGSDILNSSMYATDFKTKDLSVRRSRILQSFNPMESELKAELPKSLEPNARQHSETVAIKLKPELGSGARERYHNGKSIFGSMMAARARDSSKEYSQSRSPVGMPPLPQSRSQFKRVNLTSIAGVNQQVWRREESPQREETPLGRVPVISNIRVKAKKAIVEERLPSKARGRNTGRHLTVTNSKVRDVLKDLMEQKHPTLEPMMPLTVRKPKAQSKPRDQVNLKNKLAVSPLNQELRGLGPVTARAPTFKEPFFTKYSHREVIIAPRKVSPATQADAEKPSLISKTKAAKLVMLSKAIKSLD